MYISQAAQEELWRHLQHTFTENPTKDNMNTLAALVERLAVSGGLPLTARQVWRPWATKYLTDR